MIDDLMVIRVGLNRVDLPGGFRQFRSFPAGPRHPDRVWENAGSRTKPDLLGAGSEPSNLLQVVEEMDIKDEVDKAVDDLFGKYAAKSKDIAREGKEIPLVQDKKHKTPALGKGEVDQIKALTSTMLKLLSLAVKSDSWGHRLYYSHQFMQIAMSIAKQVTVRK